MTHIDALAENEYLLFNFKMNVLQNKDKHKINISTYARTSEF